MRRLAVHFGAGEFGIGSGGQKLRHRRVRLSKSDVILQITYRVADYLIWSVQSTIKRVADVEGRATTPARLVSSNRDRAHFIGIAKQREETEIREGKITENQVNE
jgi:hypothetical protein